MASYFSYFPNVYIGEGITEDESFKYRLVKNIFRRVKARDDLEKYTTQFEAYSIRDGETPSSLAYKFYEDQFLDWVFWLLTILQMYMSNGQKLKMICYHLLMKNMMTQMRFIITKLMKFYIMA